MINERDLCIVHYSHPDCMPLKNILRLSRDEAFAKAMELSDRHQNSAAFHRFADFERYYPLRCEVDEILRRSFVKLGGDPKEQHPLFFVLQGNAFLKNWFDSGRVTKIPLSIIPSEDISFTFGDSSAVFVRTGKVHVMRKETLLASIRSFPGTLEEYLQEMEDNHHYIEAQLWDDALLQ